MTKTEFVKNFHLSKGNKITFADGLRLVERTCYTDPFGGTFVFYGNDLHSVRSYTIGDGTVKYRLGAGYSWYR